MAGSLGASSAAILASRLFYSPSQKHSIPFLTSTTGHYEKKFYEGVRKRSQFSVAVSNIATDINYVNQDLKSKRMIGGGRERDGLYYLDQVPTNGSLMTLQAGVSPLQ